MRILFAGIRPGFPQRINGAAVSTHLLGDLLAQNGAAVHILCGKADDGDVDPVGPPPRYTIERVTDPLDALPATVAAFAPDLAVLSARATIELARQLDALGIPVVVYQRDLAFGLLQEYSTVSSGAPLGVFACSRFIADELLTGTGVEATFLPNIFPRETYAVPAPGKRVTLINPVPEKGVDLVLDLAARHRDLSFLFVEGWNLTPRQETVLLRRAADAGNIRWLRRVADMRPVYAQTRVLLVPSRWKEAWGRVVTEAQISGIPVIASDHGGLRESVGDGGYLLPHDDVDAWSTTVRRVMTDADLWADLSARALAHSRREDLDPNWILSQFVCHIRAWLQGARDRTMAD